MPDYIGKETAREKPGQWLISCESLFLKDLFNARPMTIKKATQVLIIGGGATGTALARDLSLRGLTCLLVEKNDITSGASGANHGLLHSGARYVYSDSDAAQECAAESKILKAMAPHCVEVTGGLFVAVAGDNEAYAAEFPSLCSKSNIKAEQISPQEARQLEPKLSNQIIAAYRVEDAAIDPFKLSLDMLQDACQLGCRYLSHHKVVGMKGGRDLQQIFVEHRDTKEQIIIEAEMVVSASGTWAAEVAKMAGVELDMIYAKGSLLISHSRLATMVINRLRPPSDADIIVPGGTVSVLGTTSMVVEKPDHIYPSHLETESIIEECAKLMPSLLQTRFIRAYCGVRPLIGGPSDKDSRSISRGFALIDHAVHGIENFITITGGKLTTCRLMAEKTADLVCEKLKIKSACKTRTLPVGSAKGNQWTEPGLAPVSWMNNRKVMGEILCECELVSTGSISNIAELMKEQGQIPTLTSIGLRSRVGKGPCQGGFCSLRITAHMYDQGYLDGAVGNTNIKVFLNNRWRGLRPVISGLVAGQAELQEAMHCGVFSQDLGVVQK